MGKGVSSVRADFQNLGAVNLQLDCTAQATDRTTDTVAGSATGHIHVGHITKDRAAGSADITHLTNGILGCLIGGMLDLDVGTTTALGILAASASYIAVPAAMRLALPKADAGLYLTMSLAITFPFNITIGISVYTAIAKWIV